jgi:hypothetical protein
MSSLPAHRACEIFSGETSEEGEAVLMLGNFVGWNEGHNNLDDDDRVTIGGITIDSPRIGSNIRQVLNNEISRVLDQHGARAFASPKSSAAVHEAGHAVVYAAMRKGVKRVRIREAAPGNWIGMTDCRSRKPARTETPRQCLDLARSLYAGVMAEHLFDRDFREGSSLDEVIASQLVGAHAANLAGMFDQEPYWQQNVHEVVAADLIRNKDAVRVVAERLYTRNKVESPELDRLCAGVESAGRG